MKKVLDFLEGNVQWVAMALGAVYLLFMAYSYVIVSPVHVEVSGNKLGPGDIDKYIYDHPIQLLNSQINGNTNPPPLPPPQWLKEFKSAMEFSDQKPVALAQKPWVHSFPIPMVFSRSSTPQDGTTGGVPPVESLPEVPVAIMGGALPMSSAVAPPGQGASGNAVDRNFVVVAFTLSNKDLTEAFKAVKLPLSLYSTCELEAKLYRQQQDSSGNWDAETLVARLPFEQIQTPVPPTATPKQKQDFLNWATGHQREILQPTFYDVVKGDPLIIPPATPQAPVEAVAAPEGPLGLPNFDPARWDYTIDEIRQMTPEQKLQFQKAKAKHDEEVRKAKAGNRGSRGGGKGGKGGGAVGGHAPDDPDRPDNVPPSIIPNPFVLFLQQTPPRDDDPRSDDPGHQRPGSAPPPMNPQNPADPAAPGQPETPQTLPCPNGMFDPSNPTTPEGWVGWAFDETVEPGKTYRYHVQYSIKNPLFDRPKNCKNPEMAKVLALSSDLSKTLWTLPVKVPARTSFYIARSPLDVSSSVQFQVFAWQGGAKRTKTFDVSPGDVIGGMDGTTDYATGSILVDIVADPRNPGHAYVLVADPTGAITRRDYSADQANPDFASDKRAVAAGGAPPAAGSMAETR